MCDRHPDLNVEYFSKNDNQFVCRVCFKELLNLSQTPFEVYDQAKIETFLEESIKIINKERTYINNLFDVLVSLKGTNERLSSQNYLKLVAKL